MSERFEHRPREFVGVAGPSLIYVGIADRGDFDKINAPLLDSGENENGHVLSKRVGSFKASEVTVVFQYWLKSLTTEAMLADAQRKHSDPAKNAASC